MKEGWGVDNHPTFTGVKILVVNNDEENNVINNWSLRILTKKLPSDIGAWKPKGSPSLLN